MGYMNEFPHSRMFDSDLREILELFEGNKKLPLEWENFRREILDKFTTLENFTYNYFNDLNVQNEINDKIDELIDSGNFEILVNRALARPFVGNVMNVNRLFRVLKERFNYGDAEYKLLNNTKAFSLQSLTIYNNNVICAFTNSDDTKATLAEYTMEGLLVREADLPLKHANSSTMVNNKIYIATVENSIIVVDYTTFTIDKIIQLDIPLRAVAYDKITNKLYGAGGNRYYEISDDCLTLLFTRAFGPNSIYQSFCVDNGIFYEVSSKPEVLTVFNDRGLILNQYKFNAFNGYFPFGEAEDVEYYNGSLYMASQWQLSYDNYRHNNVWKYDLTLGYNPIETKAGLTLDSRGTIYCKSASESTNPDGSEANAYKTLSEAIAHFMSPKGREELVDQIFITGEFRERLFLRNMSIRIAGTGTTKSTIYCGIDAINTRFYMQNVRVLQTDSAFENTLRATSSEVHADKTNFANLNEGSLRNIVLSHSFATLMGNFVADDNKASGGIYCYYAYAIGNNQAVLTGDGVNSDEFYSNL